MRVLLICSFLAIPTCVAPPVAPPGAGGIRSADLREITAVVRATDSHPIIFINRIYESHPTPGSRPVTEVQAGPIQHGRVSNTPITVYERTDQVAVWVATDEGKSTGGSYLVAKRGNEWKIVRKSFWIR